MHYGVRTSRPITEKYVEAAAKGMNANIVAHTDVLQSKNCDKVVFMGVLRGTHLVYKWADENKKDFYYIDRPYWGESRKSPYWMRCVKNQHSFLSKNINFLNEKLNLVFEKVTS